MDLRGVNVYIMTTSYPGEIEGVPVAHHYRPAYDSAPDHQMILTERELETLRRRISGYLETCWQRRIAEHPRYQEIQASARKGYS